MNSCIKAVSINKLSNLTRKVNTPDRNNTKNQSNIFMNNNGKAESNNNKYIVNTYRNSNRKIIWFKPFCNISNINIGKYFIKFNW